jgi:hypothetical protein
MNPPYRADAFRILTVLLGALAVILILIGGYANESKQPLMVGASGALITISFFAVGAVLGLLFGVPHSSDQTGSGGSPWSLLPNTSFDQMSDWLTKILVGVGLTQLVGVPSRLQALGSYLAPALGGSDTSADVAVALVIASSTIGFMTSFVFTKLVLSPDLADASYATLQDRVATAVDQAPGGKALAPDQKRKATRAVESFARAHYLIGDGNRVDATDLDDFAKHAVESVKGEKTRTGQ